MPFYLPPWTTPPFCCALAAIWIIRGWKIGPIGLIKAVNTFCPARNIKLATYASRCIENEILMYLRKFQSIKNEVSIDEPGAFAVNIPFPVPSEAP